MKKRYRMTDTAVADLSEVWEEIAKHSPSNADRFCGELLDVCQHAADFPESGRLRPELKAGYRSFPHDSYVILYRIIEDTVEIMRIAHGARNLRKLVRRRKS